uniref:Uncharacterized protein n=1 Tax=Timema genevievae TaxID=629358 RepID=A0A7R9PN02_TIMGE|nr:unnamed protein product [Timema genevievae]
MAYFCTRFMLRKLMPPSTLGSYAMSGCLLTRHNHTPPSPPNRGTVKRSLQVAGLVGALAVSWRMYRYLQDQHTTMVWDMVIITITDSIPNEYEQHHAIRSARQAATL